MPEGVEAEKLCRQLDEAWRGKRVKHISLSGRTGSDGQPIAARHVKNRPAGWLSNKIKGALIHRVSRIGKQILIPFSTQQGEEYFWRIHLGHTGWWLPYNESAKRNTEVNPISSYFIHELPEDAITCFLVFENGDEHAYYDPRTLSRWYIDTKEELDEIVKKEFGPDWILNRGAAAAALWAAFVKRPTATIKSLMLDQTIATGVGNYIACEAAYRAKVHPLLKVQEVPHAKAQALVYHHLPNFIGQSLFTNDHSHWKVFQHSGTLCPQCRQVDIAVMKDSARPSESRSTYFCPVCQPIEDDEATTETAAHDAG